MLRQSFSRFEDNNTIKTVSFKSKRVRHNQYDDKSRHMFLLDQLWFLVHFILRIVRKWTKFKQPDVNFIKTNLKLVSEHIFN